MEVTMMRHVLSSLLLMFGLALLFLSQQPASGQARTEAPEVEDKAVLIGSDGKECTKTANDLAKDGCQDVSPLGNGRVAFNQAVRAAPAGKLKQFHGSWIGVAGVPEGWTSVWEGDKHLAYEKGKLRHTGVWKIDPSMSPKTFDYTIDYSDVPGWPKGGVVRGIYEFEGDTLRICYVLASSKKPRPREFSTKAKGGILQVWKRKKK
jgi:uncharacterized protein (TIGR03067 family)